MGVGSYVRTSLHISNTSLWSFSCVALSSTNEKGCVRELVPATILWSMIGVSSRVYTAILPDIPSGNVTSKGDVYLGLLDKAWLDALTGEIIYLGSTPVKYSASFFDIWIFPCARVIADWGNVFPKKLRANAC